MTSIFLLPVSPLGSRSRYTCLIFKVVLMCIKWLGFSNFFVMRRFPIEDSPPFCVHKLWVPIFSLAFPYCSGIRVIARWPNQTYRFFTTALDMACCMYFGGQQIANCSKACKGRGALRGGASSFSFAHHFSKHTNALLREKCPS